MTNNCPSTGHSTPNLGLASSRIPSLDLIKEGKLEGNILGVDVHQRAEKSIDHSDAQPQILKCLYINPEFLTYKYIPHVVGGFYRYVSLTALTAARNFSVVEFRLLSTFSTFDDVDGGEAVHSIVVSIVFNTITYLYIPYYFPKTSTDDCFESHLQQRSIMPSELAPSGPRDITPPTTTSAEVLTPAPRDPPFTSSISSTASGGEPSVLCRKDSIQSSTRKTPVMGRRDSFKKTYHDLTVSSHQRKTVAVFEQAAKLALRRSNHPERGSTNSDNDREAAAVKIQKATRGFQTRRSLQQTQTHHSDDGEEEDSFVFDLHPLSPPRREVARHTRQVSNITMESCLEESFASLSECLFRNDGLQIMPYQSSNSVSLQLEQSHASMGSLSKWLPMESPRSLPPTTPKRTLDNSLHRGQDEKHHASYQSYFLDAPPLVEPIPTEAEQPPKQPSRKVTPTQDRWSDILPCCADMQELISQSASAAFLWEDITNKAQKPALQDSASSLEHQQDIPISPPMRKRSPLRSNSRKQLPSRNSSNDSSSPKSVMMDPLQHSDELMPFPKLEDPSSSKPSTPTRAKCDA